MRKLSFAKRRRPVAAATLAAMLTGAGGCIVAAVHRDDELAVRSAIEGVYAARAEEVAAQYDEARADVTGNRADPGADANRLPAQAGAVFSPVNRREDTPAPIAETIERDMLAAQLAHALRARPPAAFDSPVLTLGTYQHTPPAEPQTQPAETTAATAATRPAAEPPEGYWRKTIWHQMGHEAKALGGRDFWRGFKTSFWDLENALVLTATMGASIAIRETGVDDTIRGRVKGHRQLGDMDETIQILGNPGTHFAGAGVLWLASALTKDMKQHEVAQSLTQALAVNGVTTLILKVSTNTRAPDGEDYAWPSGHTSSAFTVAAVVNEYYGPWAGIPSLALAGLVGYQRLDSRVHDFSDVVFGGMLGYIIGTSIARDNRAEFPELFGMKVVPYADPDTGASGLALYKGW